MIKNATISATKTTLPLIDDTLKHTDFRWIDVINSVILSCLTEREVVSFLSDFLRVLNRHQ